MRGKRRLTRWQPDTDATITNIIGLPRMLMGQDAARLYHLIHITHRSHRQALFANRQMVEWGLRHAIKLEEASDIARAFYSDLRARRKMLEQADRANAPLRDSVRKIYPSLRTLHQLREHVRLERRSGAVDRDSFRFSLELCLIGSSGEREKPFLQQIDPVRWHALEGASSDDCALNLSTPQLKECVDSIRPRCVLLVREIRGLVALWSSLALVDRERLVLDLFVLMTITKSLAPVTWAIQRVPELIHEFAHFRLVYARTGPRQRCPTQRQTIWIRCLWRRQLAAVRSRLLLLNSTAPTACDLSDLRRQSLLLKLIHKTRERHRRLNVRTVNP